MNGQTKGRSLRVRHFAALLFLPTLLVVGGCEQVRQSPIVRNTARAMNSGQLWEQFSREIRDGNGRPDETAQKLLETKVRFNASSTAWISEQLVAWASQMQMRAMKMRGEEKKVANERSARGYRLALKWWPDFDSGNTELLNSLGYFLAGQGTTKEDGKTAERLTRRAIRLYDARITQMEQDGVADGNVLNYYRIQRTNVRDSVAWALYRQGRYEDALKVQLETVREMRAWVEKRLSPDIAEIVYHLGAIYDKLGKTEQAIAAYEETLTLEPTEEGIHETALAALQRLYKSTGRTAPKRAPRREAPGREEAPENAPDRLPLPPPPSSEPSLLA